MRLLFERDAALRPTLVLLVLGSVGDDNGAREGSLVLRLV